MSKPLNVFEAPLKGVSLVEASAGTGKTYNITSLYVRAILERGLQPSQILVMTYTEAATAELKLRLRNRLKESMEAVRTGNPGDDDFLRELVKRQYSGAEEKLKSAIDAFDEASVFTIHGFCTRLLTEYSLQFDVPADYELLTDDSELLQDCVDEYWRNFIRNEAQEPKKRILLDYLGDVGFGPDELMSVVREIINHSYTKLEPSGLNYEKLLNRVAELKVKFVRIQDLWGQEGKQLSEIFFSGDLNGIYFKPASRVRDWEIFTSWIGSPAPKISISDRLKHFGTYMEEKGSSKSYAVPHLDIFKAVDEYRELAAELELLKPAFVIASVEKIKADFEEAKKSSNLLSYNDLLESVEKGLRSNSSGYLVEMLSKKFPVALVDEFQDTDPIQYSIFRQIYQGKEKTALFMIGDPKQAIYGFRGADIFTYLEAREDASEAQSFTLDYNYRSNREMISSVNEIFQCSNSPFLIEGLDFKPAQFPPGKEEEVYLINASGKSFNPLQCITLEDGSNNKKTFYNWISEVIANEIVELLNGGYSLNGEEVREKDIAILVRTGRQGELIQDRLREKGLSSVLKSKTSVFDTKEAEEFFLVLKAIQKISYEPGLRAALSTELLGYNAPQILELLNNDVEWAKVIERFFSLKELWERKGIEAVSEQFFREFKVWQELAEYPSAERRITNLKHLTELLASAERDRRLYGKALLKWFYGKRHEDSANSEEEQLRLESDEDLIQISTMHSAKGLQYPIVFCPFLWDPPREKDKNSILKFYKEDQVHLDVSTGVPHENRSEFNKLAIEQEQAELVRLTYVALTRSISACYIVLPDYKDIYKSSLSSIVSSKEGKTKANYEAIKKAFTEGEFIKVREPVKTGGEIKGKEVENTQSELLESAQLQRNDLHKFPRMLSYSSLYGGKEQGDFARDYDAVYEPAKDQIQELNQFGFPKGANAGTCLHMIFEEVDFEQPDNLEQVVSKNLEYYGFSSKWEQPVQHWIQQLLNHKLKNTKLVLSNLLNRDILKEMEFYFPVQNLRPAVLWELVRGTEALSADLESVSGFMKGFVDLIFKAEGKYYILDYKSNHLGNSFEDYIQKNLKEEMSSSGYDLQYHIYTLAVHRFLRSRLPDYDYEQHFGGVFYVFMRGVKPGKPGSGVFFDKPSAGLIKKLDGQAKGDGG